MTYTVLGSDDESLRISVTDARAYKISVVDNDSKIGTTVTEDATNNLQVIALTSPAGTGDYNDDAARAAISATGSLSYNSSTGVMSYTQPTTVSVFTNDAGYITSSDIPGNVSAFTNDAGYITDYTVTQSDVTTHQAALSITESQISDLAHYNNFDTDFAAKDTDDLSQGTTNLYFSNGLARSAISATGSLSYNSTTGVVSYTQPTNVSTFANDAGYLTAVPAEYLTQTEGDARYLQSFTETNDLSSAVTWANVPDANITQTSVTQHQAALSITQSQITDLDHYTDTDANAAIDARVTGTYIEGLTFDSDGGTY